MDDATHQPAPLPEAAPLRRRRRRKRLAIGLAVAAALYTLFGFVGVPLLIHKVIVPRLERRVNGSIGLERARFNPYTFSLRLWGGSVKDSAGVPVAGFEAFEGNFRPFATIFKPGWRFGPATVITPFAVPEVAPDGRLNLAALRKPPTQPGAPLKKIPHIYIERVAVKSARVAFADHSLPAPFSAEWREIDFNIEPVDTDPAGTNPHRMTAVSKSGESADWNGTVHVNPLSSAGQLHLQGIDLSQFMPYAMLRTTARLSGGTADILIEYEFAPVRSERVARVKIPTLRIAGAKLHLNDRPLADAESVELTGLTADAAARTMTVDLLKIAKPVMFARREPSGAFEITSALLAGSGAAPTAAPAGNRRDPLAIEYPIDQLLEAISQLVVDASGGWSVKVAKVEISGGAGTYTDASTRTPVEVGLSALTITAGPLGTEDRWKIPFEASVLVGRGEGRLEAKGFVAVQDQVIEAQLNTDGVALGPFGPYIPRQLPAPLAPMDLTSGTLALDGRLSAALSRTGPRLKYNGVLGLADLRLSRPEVPDAGVLVRTVRLSGTSEVHIGASGLELLATDSDARIEALQTNRPFGTPVQLDDGVTADPQSATFDADGRLGATLDAGGSAKVTWAGKSSFSSVNIKKGAGAAGSAEGTLLTLARLDLQGDLAADAPAGAEGQLTWKGSANLGTLDGATPDDQYKVATASASADGDLRLQLGASGEADVDYRGRAALAGFRAQRRDPDRSVEAASIRLDDIDFRLKDRAATVREVAIDGSNTRAVVELMPPPSSAGGTPSEQSPMARLGSAIPYDVRIGTLKITNSELELRDPATSPPVSLSADQINVELSNVATRGGEATINAAARLQRLGKTTVIGKVDATSQTPSADLVLEISSLGLKPFDPFAARFVGYLIESGRLTAQMPLKIEGSKVSGQLDFAFDNLHLGESVPSPDAPGIPVKLGLDLLRDPGDRIVGKVPFEGNMADPGFRFSGLIWRAFFGFLGKVATAPFTLIGSLFGAAEGQDISRVVFDGGSADLNAKALSNTDVIGKAMRERPSIRLVVVGRAGGEGDIKALKALLLREAILRRVQARDNRVQTLAESRYKSEMEGQYKDVLGEPSVTDAAGRSRRMSFEEMEAALLAQTQVPADRLADLARRRAEAVIAVLAKDHGVSAERMRTGSPEASEKPVDEPIAEFRVE